MQPDHRRCPGISSAPKSRPHDKAFNMINLSGYNIGASQCPTHKVFLAPRGRLHLPVRRRERPALYRRHLRDRVRHVKS